MFPRKYTEEDRWDFDEDVNEEIRPHVKAKRIDRKVICVPFDDWFDISKNVKSLTQYHYTEPVKYSPEAVSVKTGYNKPTWSHICLHNHDTDTRLLIKEIVKRYEKEKEKANE